MLDVPHHPLTVLVFAFLVAGGCSRGSDGDRSERSGEATGSVLTTAGGDEAVAAKVRTAARAMAEPDPSVDFVAAEMAGVIKARTNSQALMHYEGYRVTMTTPRSRVTRITFDLAEAKPSMRQLTELFGQPEEVGRGYLYEYYAEATGATIRILAEPVSKPATESSLARKILVEGAHTR